jgi:hypothetical protein
MVDGGNEYQRYGGLNLDLIDISSTIYLSDDHNVNRLAAHWGNRGKDGKSPLSYKSVAEMSTDHLENIIRDMGGRIAPWIENIMLREIIDRITNNITIDD